MCTVLVRWPSYATTINCHSQGTPTGRAGKGVSVRDAFPAPPHSPTWGQRGSIVHSNQMKTRKSTRLTHKDGECPAGGKPDICLSNMAVCLRLVLLVTKSETRIYGWAVIWRSGSHETRVRERGGGEVNKWCVIELIATWAPRVNPTGNLWVKELEHMEGGGRWERGGLNTHLLLWQRYMIFP